MSNPFRGGINARKRIQCIDGRPGRRVWLCGTTCWWNCGVKTSKRAASLRIFCVKIKMVWWCVETFILALVYARKLPILNFFLRGWFRYTCPMGSCFGCYIREENANTWSHRFSASKNTISWRLSRWTSYVGVGGWAVELAPSPPFLSFPALHVGSNINFPTLRLVSCKRRTHWASMGKT